MQRNNLLDEYRGFTIISMVLFHACYDINLYKDLAWYDGTLLNHIWQLSIAISFFIISGITSNYLSPQKNISRGIKISILGLIITIITYLFDKNLLIVFGVLNGLGLSMIIVGLLEDKLKIDVKFAFLFIALFIITYRLPSGMILVRQIESSLYSLNLFPIGFPSDSFYSTDYFPIIPWLFIYIGGFILGNYFIKNETFKGKGKENLLAKIGRHSIEIYLAHQIVIYLIVYLIFEL